MSETEKEKMAEITKRFRLLAGMTLEEFGAALTERMYGYKPRSRQHVSAWETGKQPVTASFALAVYGTYWRANVEEQDWRARWASEILEVYKQAQRPVEIEVLNIVEKAVLNMSRVEVR